MTDAIFTFVPKRSVGERSPRAAIARARPPRLCTNRSSHDAAVGRTSARRPRAGARRVARVDPRLARSRRRFRALGGARSIAMHERAKAPRQLPRSPPARFRSRAGLGDGDPRSGAASVLSPVSHCAQKLDTLRYWGESPVPGARARGPFDAPAPPRSRPSPRPTAPRVAPPRRRPPRTATRPSRATTSRAGSAAPSRRSRPRRAWRSRTRSR